MYRFVLSLIVIVLIAGSVVAEDYIRNPVEFYSPDYSTRTVENDSLMIGHIYYETLPEFRKPTKVIVEFIAQFDHDQGAFIELSRQNDYLLTSPTRFTWTEPVKIGDIITAEFMITPQTVGFFTLDFQIYQMGPFDYKGKTYDGMPRDHMRSLLVLGIDGKTFAANTEYAGHAYAPIMGPNPDLLRDSVVFLQYPKEQNEITTGLTPRIDRFKFYAIKTVVYLNVDAEGYRQVKYLVGPHHDFPSGISMIIVGDKNILYKDIVEAELSAVTPADEIEFGFKFKAPTNSPSRISVAFRSDNPDSGNVSGLFSRQPFVHQTAEINFYENSNHSLQFITNLNPITFLRSEPLNSNSKSGFHYRYKFIRKLIRGLSG